MTNIRFKTKPSCQWMRLLTKEQARVRLSKQIPKRTDANARQLTSKVIEDACKPLSESEVEPTKKVLHEALMDDN